MAAFVTLKRFDSLDQEGRAPDLAPSKPSSQNRPNSNPQETEQILDPMPVQPSPEQEKAAAQQRALEASQLQLTQLLKSIDQELNAARSKVCAGVANAFGESALALLPGLLDQGFAQELAIASIKIAAAVEPDRITLCVHPNDHEPIVDALHSLSPPRPVTVEKDSSLTKGHVRLFWSDGGAEIDQAALLQHAQDLLRSEMASLTSGNTLNEH